MQKVALWCLQQPVSWNKPWRKIGLHSFLLSFLIWKEKSSQPDQARHKGDIHSSVSWLAVFWESCHCEHHRGCNLVFRNAEEFQNGFKMVCVWSKSKIISLSLFLLVNKHKPWIESSYHGVITENTDAVLLDPPLVALDKDAPVPYAGKKARNEHFIGY